MIKSQETKRIKNMRLKLPRYANCGVWSWKLYRPQQLSVKTTRLWLWKVKCSLRIQNFWFPSKIRTLILCEILISNFWLLDFWFEDLENHIPPIIKSISETKSKSSDLGTSDFDFKKLPLEDSRFAFNTPDSRYLFWWFHRFWLLNAIAAFETQTLITRRWQNLSL